MKTITQIAIVNEDKCIGCRICERICPVLAIHVGDDRKAKVIEKDCTGCQGCEQRCPKAAISMKKIEQRVLEFKWDDDKQEEINKLCRKANFNPEQVICYCTETRAQEVAASILAGNDTPEKLSKTTGIRLGCKIECIQPILRLLTAAGIELKKPEGGGYQWYGLTPTVFDISDDIRSEYESHGFYFNEDQKIFEEVRDKKTSKERK